jgi:MFS family permease
MTAEIAGAAAPSKATASAADVAARSSWPPARVAYYTLFVLILSTTCSQLDIAIVPYLGPAIKADLHLSDYAFSLMVGLSFGLFYTAVGVPIAWFLDRFSRKRLLAAAITVWSIGTALCGVAQTYTQLFLARFLVGAGEAVNGPAAYSMTADLFPRERMPRAVAILQIGSVAGPALTTLISFFALTAFLHIKPIPVPFGVIHGWQLIFILVGLPGLLIALLMLTTMPEPKRQTIAGQVAGFTETPRSLLGGVISVFQDYGLALLYILNHWKVFGPMFLSLLVGSLGTGAIAFGPIFYQRNFGWGPAQLAGLNLIPSFILMPLGLVIGVMLAEYLQKRGRSDAALLTQIISRLIALPALLFPLMPSPWLAWGLSTLTLFSIGIGGPSQNAAFQIVTPTELRGKMTALYLFIYSVVGVALAPVVIGFISTKIVGEANIKWAIFLPTVIFGPISLFITWLGLRPYGREVERLKALEGQPG